MRSVQGAVALPRRRPRDVRGARSAVAGALVAAVLVAAGVAALDHAGSAPAPRAAPAPRLESTLLGGVPLQQASCSQWNAAPAAQRSAAVRTLTAAVAGTTPSGPATTLTAAQADGLFARWCGSPIAQHFLLYELYIRAAGFRSSLPASG